MQIINPATEEIIKEVTEDTGASLSKKFELLQSHQAAWQHLSLSERVNVLKKFINLLEENIEKLADTLTSEVGKPLQQSRNEIRSAQKAYKMACRKCRKIFVAGDNDV
jgi:acyl-CoA reductase-like NAD-dependent aldehyde dehydrogenase